MQNLQNELINILQHEDALVVDGQLNKNKLVEMALQVDPKLIKYLIKHDTFKTHFFTDVEGVLVFDKIKFQRFVNNKSFLPDSYTAFKNKIGLTINDGTTDNYITTKNDVVLAWPHKDCVLEGGQTKEDQKRYEIFWNETLAPDEIDRLLDPKVFTNWKKYDQQGEHEVTEINDNDNLIIKGNNLLALASLKKRYAGKVKLIYIDPPYNTGSDEFGYNDTFNHSTWLTFIKNRLYLAIKLLSDTGMIWINIGDEEAHYLKILMDELMPEKYLANVVWQKRTSPDSRLPLGDAHDHILVYANNREHFKANYNKIPLTDKQKKNFKNPDNDPKGPWVSTDFTATGYRPNQMYSIINPAGKEFYPPEGTCWSRIEIEYKRLKDEGRMWYGIKGDAMPRRKTYLHESEGMTPWTWWDNKDVGHNQEAKHESKALFGKNPFSTPKPERLLYRIVNIATNKGDIVLDFFGGSGTTAAVCHKLERKYISGEQITYDVDYLPIRLNKVIQGEKGGISSEVNWQGGGSFIYCELAKYNQIYADKILEADSKEKLIEVWQEMKEKAFLSYQFDKQSFDQRIEAFKTLSLDDQKKFLLEVLDKNQLYVNFSEMADETFNISKEDKRLNDMFYGKIV
jgi:adenine-specific DNA-methyltransferase